jgi:NAD(P)-dependent dehydrogenase (short-subunit alcohol dehydrogenase family)
MTVPAVPNAPATAARSATFDLTGRVAVVTGGYGVLGGSMASALAAAGARVAILGRRRAEAEAKVAELQATGAEATVLLADVLDETSLRMVRDDLVARWGRVDILLNTAGGNVARARTDGRPAFEMPMDAFDEVVRLNLHGSILPSMIFAEVMGRQRAGCIVNISSMAATQAISGVLGYSVAKGAIDNFTRWLAVDMARRFGDGIRVNAIAPGFFIATQNRGVLVAEDGSYTPRAQAIIARTPMGRFGSAEELNGVLQFLCSDAASFITGAVIPVDGGFSADTGV